MSKRLNIWMQKEDKDDLKLELVVYRDSITKFIFANVADSFFMPIISQEGKVTNNHPSNK